MHDQSIHDQPIRGQQWLEALLHLADFPARVGAELQQATDAPSEAESDCWLKIDETELTPDQTKILIGQDGLVLDSIQYLANVLLNLGQGRHQQCAYTVELAGYRAQRQAELRAMVESAVEQVHQAGQEFEMQPLSAAERRQIHTILKEFADLESFSRGQEPDRRLIIRPLQT